MVRFVIFRDMSHATRFMVAKRVGNQVAIMGKDKPGG
jgi:hypothetical protein